VKDAAESARRFRQAGAFYESQAGRQETMDGKDFQIDARAGPQRITAQAVQPLSIKNGFSIPDC
jgi:hypothetical protein